WNGDDVSHATPPRPVGLLNGSHLRWAGRAVVDEHDRPTAGVAWPSAFERLDACNQIVPLRLGGKAISAISAVGARVTLRALRTISAVSPRVTLRALQVWTVNTIHNDDGAIPRNHRRVAISTI